MQERFTVFSRFAYSWRARAFTILVLVSIHIREFAIPVLPQTMANVLGLHSLLHFLLGEIRNPPLHLSSQHSIFADGDKGFHDALPLLIGSAFRNLRKLLLDVY